MISSNNGYPYAGLAATASTAIECFGAAAQEFEDDVCLKAEVMEASKNSL
jgi:hypothetical protein